MVEERRSVLQLIIDATRSKLGAAVFATSASKVSASAASATKSMQLLFGVTGILGVTLALRASIGIMAEFEETMAKVAGVTGSTAAEMDLLTGKAREMGATTRFSASQAADGLLSLSRAGFDATQSTTALVGVLNLATVGEIALGQAADVTVNILNQFQLAATDTERVVDVLAKTANSATTTISILADSFKLGGTTAGALGIDLETTAAAFGVLANNAIKGGQAGSALRNTLLGLTIQSEKSDSILAELGLTFDDVSLKSNSLVAVLNRLRDANIEVDQAAELVGKRNANALVILARNTQALVDLTQQNRDAAGTSKRFADILNRTLKGAALELKSAIQELFLQAGDKGLLGAFTGMIRLSTDVLRFLGGMELSVKANIPLVKALAGAVTLLGAELLILGLAKTITLVKGLTLAFIGLQISLAPVILSLVAIGVLFASFSLGNFILNEIGPVALAFNKLSEAISIGGRAIVETFDILFATIPIIFKGIFAELVRVFNAGLLLVIEKVSTAVNDLSKFTAVSKAFKVIGFDIKAAGKDLDSFRDRLVVNAVVTKTLAEKIQEGTRDIRIQAKKDIADIIQTAATARDEIRKKFVAKEIRGEGTTNIFEFIGDDMLVQLAFVKDLIASFASGLFDPIKNESAKALGTGGLLGGGETDPLTGGADPLGDPLGGDVGFARLFGFTPEKLMEANQAIKDFKEEAGADLLAYADIVRAINTTVANSFLTTGAAITGVLIDQAIAAKFSAREIAAAAFFAVSNSLKALAQEAGAKALFALAEGLLTGDPRKFAAAAAYGKVALLAGAGAVITGRLGASIQGQSREEERGLSGTTVISSGGGATAVITAQQDSRQALQIVNIDLRGSLVGSPAEIARQIGELLDRFNPDRNRQINFRT